MNFACALFICLFILNFTCVLSFAVDQIGETVITYKIQNLFPPFVSLRNFHPTKDHVVGCIFLTLSFA